MAKILLVEDNEMNREMLVRRLTRLDFDVVTAGDGQEAIDQANNEHPDIVLMDMSLPVMDGWEATRKLKEDDKTKAIPVVGLSAHAMKDDADKAMQAGCDDYDTKPVDMDRLLNKISALLEK
ncbi:MAG: response regulator [Gammaproteobacteria bacterium]|nr:response regulator [Gammaproteobacteria bacterium]MDH5776993.1 response regulator [Gammaproteobacteria bacterium]